MARQSDTDLKKHFEKSRIHGSVKDVILISVYFPLGFILAIIRLFMLFHIYIISFLLPISTSAGRIIIRFMLILCGLTVRVRDEDYRRDTCPVIVCNYISPVDRLIFSLVQNNIMPNEWGLPPFISMLFGLKDLNEESSRDTFLQNARTLCQRTEVPVFTRPEGLPTSGKHGLLKFSTWQFSISDSVQPVVLEARRPMPISLTTLTSTGLSDMIYFLCTPYTLFTVRYLPVVSKLENESPERFAERVREYMAKSLNVIVSPYSRHDRNELLKRLRRDTSAMGSPCDGDPSAQPAAPTTTPPSPNSSQPLIPRLESMVQYCKQVAPQVPLDVLRSLVTKTEDAEHTLAFIFEGNIEYTPEDVSNTSTSATPQAPATTSTPPANSSLLTSVTPSPTAPPASQTYKEKVFARQSGQRHLSLAERKRAMLTEARLRYIHIHGLSITLEQIEKQQFS